MDERLLEMKELRGESTRKAPKRKSANQSGRDKTS
jgi:hypothetical protein